ncbi:MAG: VCBS repeat-containing protein, partial [bacterium]|nr:VCBS repeat-containing protein [bacterium]
MYKIDEEAEREYSLSFNLKSYLLGDHTITYYGIDKVGNREKEKTIKLYLANYLDGFPYRAENEINSSPNCLDIDKDGKLDICFLDNKANLYLVDHKGKIFPNFPVSLVSSPQPMIHSLQSPALADIDDDGNIEIIVATKNKIHVLDKKGSYLPGWPKDIAGDICSSVLVYDIEEGLNSDRKAEIIVGDSSGKLHVLNYNGSYKGSKWPDTSNIGIPITKSATIGDINLDKKLEIIIVAGSKIFAWWYCGTPLPKFPINLNSIITTEPILVDIDKDGYLEIVVGCEDGNIYIIRYDAIKSSVFRHQASGISSIVAGDVNDDSIIEIVATTYDNKLYLLNNQGNIFPNFPILIPNNQQLLVTNFHLPVLADITGNNNLEIILWSSDKKIYAYDIQGNIVPGFPKITDGHITSSPLITDLDKDGKADLIAT